MAETETITTAPFGVGQLPGFRFHPTEEELLDFYLKKMVFGKRQQSFGVIGFLNIYQHNPWDLPDLAKNGEREWYFFVPRDRKHGGGTGRPNRTTGIGYWKATGSDRRIFSLSEPKRMIGLRKTLVFYQGRAPRGNKTDWIMNEYRLPHKSNNSHPLPLDIVLCKIYRKATSLKVLEQRAVEEETRNFQMASSFTLPEPVSIIMPPLSSSSMEGRKSSLPEEEEEEEEEEDTNININMNIIPTLNSSCQTVVFKKETSSSSFSSSSAEDQEVESMEVQVEAAATIVRAESSQELGLCSSSKNSLQIPKGFELLSDLQVPKMNMDWTQDQFWNQFNSPWFLNMTTTPTNLLNF